jgi:transcriptional regulator with XRE-family HTH domain
MLELKSKFPSSEMIQKLASALEIDPTELFQKEIDPAIRMKNNQKIAFINVGEAVSQFLSSYIDEKVREIDKVPKKRMIKKK